jgi:putative Holliday junction resolvase
VAALLQLAAEREVTEIVVGLPLELDGRAGHRAMRVQVLVDALTEAFEGPVSLFDERLSTRAAEQVLLEADLSRQKRKKVVDKVAAAVILQAYLDARRVPAPEVT